MNRRQLLKYLSAIPAALFLPGVAQAKPTSILRSNEEVDRLRAGSHRMTATEVLASHERFKQQLEEELHDPIMKMQREFSQAASARMDETIIAAFDREKRLGQTSIQS